MEKRLIDVLKLLWPLRGEKREKYAKVSSYLGRVDSKEFKYWLKQGRIDVRDSVMGSKRLGAAADFPLVETETKNPELYNLVDSWNRKIQDFVKEELFKDFSSKPWNITKLIAPNIVGLDSVKEAVLLQLFAKEQIHILLLGDPGTGKTEILRSADTFAPISSFGLGSGTSGAGLTVTFKGDELVKGLLPLAHNGLCCIDELNLMKDKDRAGLLNAMEKGFVSYDKGNKHAKVDADVKVLASANPKGDQFAGWIVDTLKKQLPFDPALLSRFHLAFLIRRPDVKGFVTIAKKIVKGNGPEPGQAEIEFVKNYVQKTQELNIKFDKKLEPLITSFVKEIKTDEDKFLMEISPRLVIGLMRLSTACARMHMREKVEEQDVKKIIGLMREALYFKK